MAVWSRIPPPKGGGYDTLSLGNQFQMLQGNIVFASPRVHALSAPADECAMFCRGRGTNYPVTLHYISKNRSSPCNMSMVCTPGLTLVLPFLQGCATPQVGGHWLLTAGAWVWFLGRPCGIHDRQSGTNIVFYPNTLVYHCYHHSINVLYFDSSTMVPYIINTCRQSLWLGGNFWLL